ncbi:MAG: hypothetical protein ACOYM2_21345 [Rectinemataceae bacterium]
MMIMLIIDSFVSRQVPECEGTHQAPVPAPDRSVTEKWAVVTVSPAAELVIWIIACLPMRPVVGLGESLLKPLYFVIVEFLEKASLGGGQPSLVLQGQAHEEIQTPVR